MTPAFKVTLPLTENKANHIRNNLSTHFLASFDTAVLFPKPLSVPRGVGWRINSIMLSLYWVEVASSRRVVQRQEEKQKCSVGKYVWFVVTAHYGFCMLLHWESVEWKYMVIYLPKVHISMVKKIVAIFLSSSWGWTSVLFVYLKYLYLYLFKISKSP